MTKFKYVVCPSEFLREECIRRNWFTCGSNAQYEKLFYMNESFESFFIRDIVNCIWLCSSEEVNRSEVLSVCYKLSTDYISSL